MNIGDVFNGGRYKVIHKLGYGAVSTVWLARDLRMAPDRSPSQGRLVSLNVLSSEESSKPRTELTEPAISDEPMKFSRVTGHLGSKGCRLFWDHFMHEGPNGSHLCLVSDFADRASLPLAIGEPK